MENKLINKVITIYNRHCVYQTAYHVISCSKYRKQILIGKVAERISTIIDVIYVENDWPMITKEIQSNHIHLFLIIPPAIATAIKIFKGTTARKLFVDFPELKEQSKEGHLWSPTYYVGTAGNVSAKTIQQYIERAEHMIKRR